MANKIILKKSSVAEKVPQSGDLETGEIAVNLTDQKLYSKQTDGTVILVGSGLGGAGDVIGPASATDNAITRYSGTTGKQIQNSGATIDDNGNLTATTSQATGTGANIIPVGTTAQRPANPVAGMIRFNTDEGFVEYYDDLRDEWVPISQFSGVFATGGTVTDIEQNGQLFRVHTFTSSGTFDVTRGGDVDVFVVAGGGSGGKSTTRGAGGGGAGGYRSSVVGEPSGGGASAEPTLTAVVGAYAVTVGGGGASATDSSSYGAAGGNSSIVRAAESVNITSIGGGGGGRNDSGFDSVIDGGSGGGRGHNPNDPPGSGTAGQGFGGGPTNFDSVAFRGTSGGGAAAVGGNSGQNFIDPGGAGVSSLITGVATQRAGGGGGIGTNSTIAGAGGAGGGGAGGATGTAGAAATGGGGGAAFSGNSGAGGSGIVIVRYRIG